MTRRPALWLTALFIFLSASAFAQSTAFTYQGKLADNGNPANDSYDFSSVSSIWSAAAHSKGRLRQ